MPRPALFCFEREIRQLPAIQDPDNMDAPPGTWLAQLMYQQNLLHEKLQAQVGLMYVDSRFLAVPYGENFLSLDFSSDGSISTFVLPTYPKGSWGGDVTMAPMKGWSLRAGCTTTTARSCRMIRVGTC